MTVKNYDKTQVSYDQTICPICRINYGEEEAGEDVRIIELACKHIFHKDCFRETYIKCLMCKKMIVKDFTKINRDLITDLVQSILFCSQNKPKFFGLWRQDRMKRLIVEEIERQTKSFEDTTPQMGYARSSKHPIELLKQIQQDVLEIFQGNEQQQKELLTAHVEQIAQIIRDILTFEDRDVWLESMEIDFSETKSLTYTSALKMLERVSFGVNFLTNNDIFPHNKIAYIEKLEMELLRSRNLRQIKYEYRANVRKDVIAKVESLAMGLDEMEDYFLKLSYKKLKILELSQNKRVAQVAAKVMKVKNQNEMHYITKGILLGLAFVVGFSLNPLERASAFWYLIV
jgi:hypothetical protein